MKSGKKTKGAKPNEEGEQSFYDQEIGSIHGWPADEAPQDRFNGEWQNFHGSSGKKKQGAPRQRRTPSPRSEGIEALQS